MRKTRLFLLTVIASMSFSVTACAKENTPVAATEVASTEAASTETATEVVPSETATVPTTEAETETATEVATSTEAEPSTEAPYTEADLAEYDPSDLKYLNEVYQFMSRMDPSLEKTDDILTILNSGVLDPVTPEQLLDLLNQDFGKAYDLIEKCGLDVITDEGKELKAATMRAEAGTITDFDSFHDAYMDIIEYDTRVAEIRNSAADKTKEYLAAEDGTNAEVHLNQWKQLNEFLDELQNFIQFYQMAYDEVREG